MNWEEKLAVLLTLDDNLSVTMRKPGNWYVSGGRCEIKRKGSGVLESAYGDGKTPQEAVEDHWRQYTTLPDGAVIVIDAMRKTRREVRWNGFTWVDVKGFVRT